jgi:glutamyl-tRNA synthetase
VTTVRFAPSPTGRIHIGNARTAILNWPYSRKTGGRFVLRFDDTDRERSTEEFARGIVEGLAWLGMTPDRIERQSQRFDRYDAAAEAVDHGPEFAALLPVIGRSPALRRLEGEVSP